MIIIMGVSGTGKSTIGKLLAEALSADFYDADDFHPSINKKKMADGKPLTDTDRAPWLKKLSENIKVWSLKGEAVLACSALKESHRYQLNKSNTPIQYIHLTGSPALIRERLSKRQSHFFDPSLLNSQLEALEIPKSAISIDISKDPSQIIEELKISMSNQSEFGIIGLGVMGQNLALNMADTGTKMSVYNRHVDGKEEHVAKNFVNKHKEKPIQGFDNLDAFVKSIAPPRNILLMVQAGAAVDATITALIPLLAKGDLIIDGGNSHFQETNKRDKALAKHHIHFIGTGISGGEEGARKGPSIMPGGNKEAYERIEGFIQKIAAKDKNGQACCTYVGPEGAGHFVKMVHNGIEYAEMQLLAEIYELLKNYLGMKPEEIAKTLLSWKDKGLNSYLLEITINIVVRYEGNDLLLDKILDAASQKGTGGWSTETAIQLGSPLNTISDAVMARNLSAKKALRVTANQAYGHIKTGLVNKPGDIINQIAEAYHAARIINHAVGFDMIQDASETYGWDLNLSEIARIWTNGCIIRSELMDTCVSQFNEGKRLLLHPDNILTLMEQKDSLAEVIGISLKNSFPLPVFSSAMNFFLGYINGESSANVLQAQRDYFGAHTYKRIDRNPTESFHTNWT